MRRKKIASIDTALRIFYEYPEIGNKQIKELFGRTSSATVERLKKDARDEMRENNIKTHELYTVNTRAAYKAWGIDVEDLERRRKKLVALGFCTSSATED